jgi:predicted nucleic acid-binding protein
VRFWDASAVVPLLMAEASTLAMQKLAAADSVMLVWWAAFVGAERRPSSLELVTLDERLVTAARKEGFVVTTLEQAG